MAKLKPRCPTMHPDGRLTWNNTDDAAFWKERGEKAEHERDESHNLMRDWRKVAEDHKDEIESLKAQPRTLTADDIDDAMEQRLIRKGIEFGWFSEYDINARDTREEVRELLTAALTEPPARPEGAEELADEMEDYSHSGLLEENGLAGLADHLAAMGYRKTEDQS